MWKLFRNKRKWNDDDLSVDINNIPQHVAIIMDGNGRWAKERNLPRTMGHKAGVETIREIVKEASKLGIKFLTLYAFSTENWNRPQEEVNTLMKLLVEYLRKEFDELNKNNVIINSIGNISKLPQVCNDELISAYNNTKDNTGLTLNLALNYGGRNEITNAVKNIAKEVSLGRLSINEIDEDVISKNLYTSGMPDPDIIIRPSGEQRISNFLLWQCAYSEFWYSDIKWPDFRKEDLLRAIHEYQKRDRRFGGVK